MLKLSPETEGEKKSNGDVRAKRRAEGRRKIKRLGRKGETEKLMESKIRDRFFFLGMWVQMGGMKVFQDGTASHYSVCYDALHIPVMKCFSKDT